MRLPAHVPSLSRRLLSLAAAAAVATLLSGCVVAPGRGYEGDVIAVAPPTPQVEVVGVAPVAGWLWLPGYWGWHGGRHVWVGGHWEAPRAGHYWVPHRWVDEGGRWRLQPGYWARR